MEPIVNIFPVWKPHYHSTQKFKHSDRKFAFKALRNSSDCFIKREDVRNYIFNRDGNKCVSCGSTTNIQIDHIISVYSVSRGFSSFEILNNQTNLQTLCGKCNASKLP